MKKVLVILILMSLILPASASGLKIENPIRADTFYELITSIINFLFTISLFIAPIMIIVGGFYFLMAADNVQNIETGKKIILYTIIGFVVIMLARGLVRMLEQAFLR